MPNSMIKFHIAIYNGIFLCRNGLNAIIKILCTVENILTMKR